MFIAIYCGSSTPKNKDYILAAEELAKSLALNNYNIVYGGANVGLMKVVADNALKYHAQVIGVLPHVIKRQEIEKKDLTKLIKVNTMHERKQIMSDLANAFIALPGGSGTLDEIFEAITWAQIGTHQKPTIFYNVEGYFNPIKEFLINSVKNGFTTQENYEKIYFIDNTSDLLSLLNIKLSVD